jgi:hypothetical protein
VLETDPAISTLAVKPTTVEVVPATSMFEK